MKARTLEYWKTRALERESAVQAGSSRTVNIVNRAYDSAIENIEKEIKSALRQYGISEFGVDWSKMLTAESRQAELDKIKEALKQKATPYQARITRLEALEDIIKKECEKLAKIELNTTTARYIESINESYYHALFDMQKGLGVGFNVTQLPNRVVNTLIASNWSGKTFSRRIWGNNKKLIDRLQSEILGGILSGESIAQTRNKIMKINASGKFVAERLVRTETNYFYNQGELLSYNEAGIEKYRYLAILDLTTSLFCRVLDGYVGFVDDAEVGNNYPPMHVFCRSTTIAWFGAEALEGIERRARDPVTGKLYTVPADMKYLDWYDKFVEGNPEAMAAEKAVKNKAADERQFAKYHSVFGNEVGKTVDEFQKMKYNDSERWERVKDSKQDTFNKRDYRKEFNSMFGDKEVRLWYIEKNKNIPNLIDKTKPLKEQARQAFDLRNENMINARLMMSDREEAKRLNNDEPIKTFEEMLKHKKETYGLIGDAAYRDIIGSSRTTRKSVNLNLGIE